MMAADEDAPVVTEEFYEHMTLTKATGVRCPVRIPCIVHGDASPNRAVYCGR